MQAAGTGIASLALARCGGGPGDKASGDAERGFLTPSGRFEIRWHYNLPYVGPDRPLCQWSSKGQAGQSLLGRPRLADAQALDHALSGAALKNGAKSLPVFGHFLPYSML